MKVTKLDILLIEDNLSEAELVKEMLSEAWRLEFTVQHVQRLAEGLSLLQRQPFDVVLVDLRLPDSQGLETALSVRRHAPSTPVVALTVLDDESAALKSLQMDIQDYLIKEEITANLLIRAIRYAIHRKCDFESLRDAQSQLQLITDTMADGVARCSKDLRYLWVNSAYARWLGRSPQEMVGQPIKDIIGATAYGVISPYVERVLTGERVEYEARVDYQGPGSLWISAIYVPAFDSKGIPDGWVAVVTDMTERKRVEEALRLSEAKFSKVFRAAPGLVSISTLDEGRYLDVNDEFLKLLGFERNEVIGHTGVELGICEPSDHHLLLRMVRQSGTVRDFEARLQRKSDATIIGLVSMDVIEIEGERYLFSITKDITGLRKTEEERTRLAMIVESSNDAIIGKTLDGIITSWNRGAENMYGFSAQEVIGKHVSILAPQDQPDDTTQILDKLKQGEVIEQLERSRVKKDGTFIQVSLTISPIRNGKNNIVGASTIARDITEHKRNEEEIRRLNRDLSARADELETANRDLEAFNYTVAHDLRRPLNMIGSYCQAIDMMCGDKLQKECRDYVQGAYLGTLRMNQLIEALLNFARLAHVEPRRETVDLSASAHRVAEELRQGEPERQVEFRISEGVTAIGDANLLRVVLDNLLGNAWKYTGIREKAVIEFGTTAVDGRKIYFIRDNGQGFDMADAAQLFTPFKRLPGAEQQRGFGIGLATVERIIGRHGGKVWAEGGPDRGATFFFTIQDQ